LLNDTITAIVTAMGAAGVGIIRISGPDAIKIADKTFKGKSRLIEAKTHSVNYGKVYDYKDDRIIDEALYLVMKEPASFTGEDVVEIQCHGGMIPVRRVLELVLNNGARLAEKGEFSKRAFLNGKLDLAQAESIMDIVNAKTEKGLDVAVNQLQGSLSKMINDARNNLLELIAYIEADIDFPEEDIERLDSSEILKKVTNIKEKIIKILETSQKGKIIREGLNVIIIGKPNVGKSSLLNALLKENKAIVTDIPGTTRDVIEEYINLGGVPIKIIDTAGIRETSNLVEKIGVEKAKDFIKKADLVLLVLDVFSGIAKEDMEILDSYLDEIPTIVLVNKIDLDYKIDVIDKIKKLIGNKVLLQISAKENEGLEKLEKQILDMFFAGHIEISQDIIVTNARHVQALKKSIELLDDVLKSLEKKMPGDFLVIDLRGSWESLGQITGDALDDNILDQIFSRFCLGK